MAPKPQQNEGKPRKIALVIATTQINAALSQLQSELAEAGIQLEIETAQFDAELASLTAQLDEAGAKLPDLEAKLQLAVADNTKLAEHLASASAEADELRNSVRSLSEAIENAPPTGGVPADTDESLISASSAEKFLRQRDQNIAAEDILKARIHSDPDRLVVVTVDGRKIEVIK